MIPEPEPVVEPEPEPVIPEPEPEKHVGLDDGTFFVIVAGIIAFILILIFARYFSTNNSKVQAIEMNTQRTTSREPLEEAKVKEEDGENGQNDAEKSEQIVEEGIN